MSYTDTLLTDRDWVRFLIGDTDTANEKLSDNEIDAVVAENPNNKYCAAAEALSTLLVEYGSDGEGILRKTVDELSIEYGTQGSPFEAIEARISWLKRRCARERSSPNGLFKAL